MSVWRRRGFTPLVASATVSEVGGQVSVLVLPVLAATLLAATPWEMGVLSAAGMAAFLVVGLPAGALVDRWRPRRVMVVCDLVRALLVVSVPLAAWAGGLGLVQLVAIAFAVGVATVFADVASFGVSALLLLRVPAPGRPPRSGRRALLAEIAEGLRYVVGHPVIRRITLCTAGINLASGLRDAVVVLFALRTLGLSPSALGVALSVGAAGGVLGAVTAGRLADLVGQGRIVPLTALVTAPFAALTPLADGVVLLAVASAGVAFAAVAYNVAQVSMRQRACPPELLGRMNASIRTLVWGTPPVGALIGGALAGAIGLRTVLWIAAGVMLVAAAPVVFSPLLRDELPPGH